MHSGDNVKKFETQIADLETQFAESRKRIWQLCDEFEDKRDELLREVNAISFDVCATFFFISPLLICARYRHL